MNVYSTLNCPCMTSNIVHVYWLLYCFVCVLFLRSNRVSSLLCRSPLPHGADQGPENSGASGGKLEDAGTRAGPILQCIGHN